MSMVEDELVKANAELTASGRTPGDFGFEVEFMEPDPDGAGMFTVTYLVTNVNVVTKKGLGSIGGIGYDWVAEFKANLEEGYFDA